MAGDWIKIEHVTPDKPEVMRIAEMLNITENEALGGLIRFWVWCDFQSRDGHAIGVTKKALDRISSVTDLFDALIDVGWLVQDDTGIHIPNFDYHLSQNAKTRALANKRQQKKRNETVTEESRTERDKNVTREEKRRDKEKSKKKKEDPYTPGFESFWGSYPRRVAKKKAFQSWKTALVDCLDSQKKHDDESAEDFLIRRASDFAAQVSDKDAEFVCHPTTWLNQGRWDDELGSRVATDDELKNWRP